MVFALCSPWELILRWTEYKLADDSGFKNALDAAGAPHKTNGLVYVNLADGLQLIYSYAGLTPPPGSVGGR